MRTIVNIPTEPAPADPIWLVKKHAGKKLNSEELLEYNSFIFNKELKDL